MTIPHTAINVTFPKPETKPAGTVIVLKFEDADLGTQARKINKSLNDLIEHAMDANPSFKGKNGQTLELFTGNNTGVKRVFVLGLGKEEDITPLTAEDAGGKLAPVLLKAGVKDATLVLDTTKKIKAETFAAHIANGFKLRSYDFDRYKSKDKNDKTPKLKTLKVLTQHAANAKAAYDTLEHVTSGVFTARDLVNTAPNDLYPDSYAKYIKTELKPLGLDVEILDDKKLEKMGMGGITAVGKGSERKPRMVIIKWSGTKKKSAKTLGFVGKGVTFDTGGISLKPGAGMDEMKMDMGGSAAVVGLLKSLALRKAKCNAVGIVGLAENMPASNAYRPGDIIKSYAGKTIEVLNTDAEGRLVLADCLTYMQEQFKPEFIIDLATLTGAMMVALGHEYCGTFANDDALWSQMEKSSAASGEKLWRMPLDKAWMEDMESTVADVQNLAKSGRWAGACTAAGFLEHFIDDGMKWAHMDIAGTAWRKKDLPTVPKYGSGFGVRVLNELIASNYED